MVILTLNCGSSSAKYQVYDWEKKDVLCSGVVERVTEQGSSITHKVRGEKHVVESPCPTHKEAIELIMKEITDEKVGVIKDMSVVGAVGHRVVQGGDKFTKSVLINDDVIKSFREVQDLAPLHNPANIMGIEAAQKVFPNIPHCAIMDTAWHQTMPESSFMYAIPREWYEKFHARKYGFHGTSFLYTAKRAAVLLDKNPLETNLIICHLGNGASMCAVKNGVSYDTTMGLTPLEGLVMGTRCGEIDADLIFYIMKKANMSADEIDKALNKKSGLLGITAGTMSDFRDLEAASKKGDKLAKLAIDMFTYRIKKFVGAYKAALGKVDAIVFTAGIGEHSPIVRSQSLAGLDELGFAIDEKKNALANSSNAETCISPDGAKTKIFVIPTDEELVMTEDAYALMKGTYDVHTKFTYSFQDKAYMNKAREEGLAKDLQKTPELKNIVVRA